MRRARAKLIEKRVDLMVLNAPREAIGLDTNRVTLVERHRVLRLPALPKRAVADAVLARVLELRAARGRADGAGAKPRRAARVSKGRP